MANSREIPSDSSNYKASSQEDNKNSYILGLNPENKKIHPAIEYFYQLDRLAPSINLKNFLSSFELPRSIDSDVFEEGVRKFIKLANSSPLNHQSELGRKILYGDNYLGLHYGNDLVKLWNDSDAANAPLKASQVLKLAPLDWDSVLQDDGFSTLIYKGQSPAQALDELVKGPTVIDCGMFTQLGLWFGIRYMLGNERFNQCFGRAPFFITQNVYNKIAHCNKPYSGNPLYSFLSAKEQAIISSVTVKHITNTPLYPLKHPGGYSGGNNCIVIENQYSIFKPHLEDTQGLTESTVLNLLRHAFNEERTKYDDERLALYAENPEQLNPKFFQTYSQLIVNAEILRDVTLTEEEFSNVEQDAALELTFDLHKFSIWLRAIENNVTIDQVDYSPLSIDSSLLPVQLLNVIPFENRSCMDFSKFKEETLQQKELIAISKKFCQSVMANESKLVILSGKAGVGKTASAACAAKELTARGKKIVWISEVMVNGWADQAKSMADLDNCNIEIDNLLASHPDAVFLDDDNLAGFSGNILLEKIYSWYVNHPGKGLFITSNEPICFKQCYGYKLDRQYHYPPFTDYYSSQYLNWQQKTDLAGESLRSKRDGQSIGAIVSDLSWKANEGNLNHVELIPGFDYDEELVPIRRSLRETGCMGATFDKLRPIQKKWIHTNQAGNNYIYINDNYTYIASFLTVTQSNFEKTTSKTIALEIREKNSTSSTKWIGSDSMDQLIRILNYAHDEGGRRIILINQTSHSNEQLLIQIKLQLPKSERERTWSRLMLLLCETEDSIFKYDQFNGHIENIIPERTLNNKSNKNLNASPQLGARSMLGISKSSERHSDRFSGHIIHRSYKNNFQPMVTIVQPRFFQHSKKTTSVNSNSINTQLPEKKIARCEMPKKFFMCRTFSAHEKEFLIQYRHVDERIQHEYDKKFGIILKK